VKKVAVQGYLPCTAFFHFLDVFDQAAFFYTVPGLRFLNLLNRKSQNEREDDQNTVKAKMIIFLRYKKVNSKHDIKRGVNNGATFPRSGR
jgi:hypothetical protein